MSPLEDIGIRVVPVPGALRDDGAVAHAVLRTIISLLQDLTEQGQSAGIDLQAMELQEADHELLAETLGEGPVTVQLESEGVSLIQETAIPGVWWITQYDSEDEVMGEFIEVTYCPEIIVTPREDVKEGLDVLRARLLEREYLPNKGSK